MKINFIDKRYRVYNHDLDITFYTKDIEEVKRIAVKNGHQLTVYTEKFMSNRWRQLKLSYNQDGTKNQPKVKRYIPNGHIYRVSTIYND